MKYILDFDRTLFDTESFYRASEAAGFHPEALDVAVWQQLQVTDFIYSDALTFLKQQQPKDVVILTATSEYKYGPAVTAYQKAKVEQEPVNTLVSEVVYVDLDKGPAIQSIAAHWEEDEPVVFVDDLLANCLAAVEVLPGCRSFVMTRGSQLPNHPLSVISRVADFAELSAKLSV